MDYELESDSDIPSEVKNVANATISNMLPAKFKLLYKKI